MKFYSITSTVHNITLPHQSRERKVPADSTVYTSCCHNAIVASTKVRYNNFSRSSLEAKENIYINFSTNLIRIETYENTSVLRAATKISRKEALNFSVTSFSIAL
jgi:hypothetical protein